MIGLALASELDPAFATALEARMGDGATLSPEVVGLLFGLTPSDLAAVTDPLAPLHRFGLVVDTSSRTASQTVASFVALSLRITYNDPPSSVPR